LLGFNRTSVELKLNNKAAWAEEFTGLIVPVWN